MRAVQPSFHLTVARKLSDELRDSLNPQVTFLGSLGSNLPAWVMNPSINAIAVRASPAPIQKGDFVMFMLSHPLAGPKPVNVTKQALCMPGERIAMIEKPSKTSHAWDGWYYCNEHLLNVSKPIGRNGMKLDHWQPREGTIPAGLIFVGSNHPDGFDSRYYGPVAIDRLKRMEKVL